MKYIMAYIREKLESRLLTFSRHPLSLGKAFTHLIYPPACLHCDEPLYPDQPLFCNSCLALLELIQAKERCPYCFSSDYSVTQRVCIKCAKGSPLFHRLASAFDYVGPASSLIKKLKYTNMPHLAKGASAYLTAQFLLLDWPLPDVIVPVPISFTRWFQRGYNQSFLLASGLGEMINRPVQEALLRKSGDFSQAGLNHRQRISLSGETILMKKHQGLQDKCILLIDDVMTTGTTMHKCAEALSEECPGRIYGLTLCHAIK